jgi:hypothetical protein
LSESTIVDLLNCPDKTERDRLTVQWRDNKLKELNFVGIVVSHSTYRGATAQLAMSMESPL